MSGGASILNRFTSSMPSASIQSTASGMYFNNRFLDRAEKACGWRNCGTFRRSHSRRPRRRCWSSGLRRVRRQSRPPSTGQGYGSSQAQPRFRRSSLRAVPCATPPSPRSTALAQSVTPGRQASHEASRLLREGSSRATTLRGSGGLTLERRHEDVAGRCVRRGCQPRGRRLARARVARAMRTDVFVEPGTRAPAVGYSSAARSVGGRSKPRRRGRQFEEK